MIRNLLASTALAALMTTGAIAQTTTNLDAQTQTNGQVGVSVFATDVGVNATVGTTAAGTATDTAFAGFTEAQAGQVLGSELMGKPVYNGASKDAKAIGEVNDIVMSRDGRAQAILIGVGGFLGIGEKQVAVNFSQLTWVEVDGEKRLVINSSEEALKNAPSFDRSQLEAGQQMSTDMNAAANGNANAGADMSTNTNATANATATQNADANAQAMASDPTAGLKAVDQATLSAEALLGARVHDGNNQDIGEVGDVIVTSDNKVEAYVVDVGGFLGLGEKPVAIAAQHLKIMANGDNQLVIFTPFTEDQLKNAPTYSKDAYAADPNQVVIK